MDVIYLDNNATTPPADEVIAAMTQALREDWANPSSLHRPGQGVKRKVELARQEVCRLLNCDARELVFTSGGTEAANFAIFGSVDAQPDRRVMVSSRTEHSAVRESAQRLAARGIEVVWLPCDAHGVVEVPPLHELLAERADQIALVSLMWANNETGVLQPIERIGAMCREHGVRYHVDATQVVGKLPVDFGSLPADLLTFASHKFHGPKGVGGIAIRRGVGVERQTIGGPHERERRGGTENVPGIIGLGVASRLAREWLATQAYERMAAERDRFEREITLRVEGAVVNCAGAPRVWNTSSIAFPRLEAEAILLMLSERGVCASAGSACASGSLEASPVLLAMGIPPELANGSVRFSLSRRTTSSELDRAIAVVADVALRLRGSMSAV